MVATDTIVGIVGAVVLVAVMAGVFVYEYNNTPEEADTLAAQQEHFEEDYAGLSAMDDIDGDGIQNFNDTDLDGDGKENAVDDMVLVTVPVNGNVPGSTPAAAGAPFETTFLVGNGSESMEAQFTYTRQASGQPNLQFTLTGPNGFSMTGSSAGTSAITVTFDVDEPLERGEYKLTVRHAPLAGPLAIAQPASFQGAFELHYAGPTGEPHPHEK